MGVRYYENAVTKARKWDVPDDLLPPLTPGAVSPIANRAMLAYRPFDSVEKQAPCMQDHVRLDISPNPTYYLPPSACNLIRRHELDLLKPPEQRYGYRPPVAEDELPARRPMRIR